MFIATILIGGIVGGLAIFLTIEFIRYAYFWALIVTGFFSLFHFNDLRGFYRSKDWLPFFGRLFYLFVISSYISGFFVFAAGLVTFAIDTLDLLILCSSIVISYIGVTFFMILSRFFPASKLYKDMLKIEDGLKALGVF